MEFDRRDLLEAAGAAALTKLVGRGLNHPYDQLPAISTVAARVVTISLPEGSPSRSHW